ncbi:MAG: PaaI family thioesterase [Abyssibacter sp.]|uniref:PaaI family thioesterase n=1 Tax=Abyssibacter sp. TaxID=2320200 RepID=UPI002E9A299E|nr:PaaI family thioesterase [Pseudomonadota bacterium]
MTLTNVYQKLKSLGGLFATLGITLDTAESAPLTRMTITSAMQGGPGVAHGGAVMALLDTALGMQALDVALKRGCATSTVEMKVNFLRPAPVGSQLYTQTEVQSEGKSLLVVTGTAFDQASDRAVAFAVGTFNVYKPNRRTNEHPMPDAEPVASPVE